MKLAVFDVDGVIYKGHSIFDVIKNQERDGFIKSGVWKTIEYERILYRSGKKNYEDAANTMLETYVSSLKGKKYEDAQTYFIDFLNKYPQNIYPYFKDLLKILKKTHDIYLLTTNLSYSTEILIKHFKIKGFISTQEEVINGLFTGKILSSMAGNKHMIKNLLKTYSYGKSIAVGDSVNDISMLEMVEHPLCLNPDHKLRSEAVKRGWKVVDENSISKSIFQKLHSNFSL